MSQSYAEKLPPEAKTNSRPGQATCCERVQVEIAQVGNNTKNKEENVSLREGDKPAHQRANLFLTSQAANGK